MHLSYLLALASLITASPLGLSSGIRRRELPSPVEVDVAKQYLAKLVVAEPVLNPPYDRKKFPHWISTGGKCDTRERESLYMTKYFVEILTLKSLVAEYDGATWTDALDLDIDHVVPLKEGWISGAWNWTTERRKMFANDLVRPQLIAVTVSAAFLEWGANAPTKVSRIMSTKRREIRILLLGCPLFNPIVAEKTALTNYLSKCETPTFVSEELVLAPDMQK
ncbi:hypothetical protein AG1IA_01603 [Rhizoctonia solani AG-1 IA]|uniref:DUF1524 domain-containing protein n=1 Tax=Thanatephorus cucumeris (strain AG1-IA) TaxID=983506 RepID=L8X2C6_THACA|nr:hypothetical protein AG1IA_01603 [Rhizoctonia solani AG-1 IA]